MFSTPPNKKPIDDLIRAGLVASGKFVFEIKINQNDLHLCTFKTPILYNFL